MKEFSESTNNNNIETNTNDNNYKLNNFNKKKTIYDKITISKKSKTIVILRTLIISLCCLFFPFEAVIAHRLQEIEMNAYVENKLLSFLLSSSLINSSTFQILVDLFLQMIGTNDSIIVFISLIYLIFHPFIGLKLILISSLAQYFVIILQIIFQAHRPLWDLDQIEAICRNTYPNPSSKLFYSSFFYLYSIISFNLLKKKKFQFLHKIILFSLYIILLFILSIMLGGMYLLYLHQIVYTLVISIVIISLLVDFDTNIHNFIFNSLKNVYNTRVYKMKIFFYVIGLFSVGFISLYFIEENDIKKIRDKISENPNCSKEDIEMFGIKQGFLDLSFLSGIIGAFWGASFTVENNVGKWWSKRSVKKSIIKILFIVFICVIFILIKYFLRTLKGKFELYFTIEAILYFLECYIIFGPLPLFFQYMGYNEQYIVKNYEKINVKLRNEEEVQFFRTTIFETEKKGNKKDAYVVLDRDNQNNEKDIKKLNKIENIEKTDKNNENNINKEEKEKDDINDIVEKKENEDNENIGIYKTTSRIIENVRKHEEEEADFDFDFENENKNTENLLDIKNNLNDEDINNDEL